jgi:hypothetical protein
MNILIILGLMAGLFMIAINNILTLFLGYIITIIALYGNYKANKLQKVIIRVNEYKVKANPDIDLDLYIPKNKKG